MSAEGPAAFIDAPGSLAVVYHWDADGVCAAALVASRRAADWWVPCANELDEAVAEEVLSHGPDRVLVLDVGGLDPGAMANLACSADVMVLDHHERGDPPAGVAFVRCEGPVSLAVHRMLGGAPWVALAGTRGDKDDAYCKRAFPTGDHAAARTVMGMLNAGKNLKGREGARVALMAVLSASSPQDIVQARTPAARTLAEYDRRIEQETRRLIAACAARAQRVEGSRVLFYDIASELNLSSRVSSILRWKEQGWVVFVYNSRIEPVPFSVRTTARDLNLAELLAATGCTSCGGHPDACGGTATREELERVKQRLAEALAARAAPTAAR